MKTVLVVAALLVTASGITLGGPTTAVGKASWYGEAHRGKLMANGQKFDPDKLTAASWFYPLGTKVRVTTLDSLPSGAEIKNEKAKSKIKNETSVQVTITDRGPALDLVRGGRIIDLSRTAFKKLAHPNSGITRVRIEPLR